MNIKELLISNGVEEANADVILEGFQTYIDAEKAELTVAHEAVLKEHQEKQDVLLVESKNELTEHLANVDVFLEHTINEWVTENKPAIHSKIKLKKAENLLSVLSEAFTKNNINVDDDTDSLLAESEKEISVLKEKLDESVQEKVQLLKESGERRRDELLVEGTANMSEASKAKIYDLSKDFSIKDESLFKEKVQVLAEAITDSSSATQSPTDEEKAAGINKLIML